MGADEPNSANSYRTQRRGGSGLIDIKTSKRNGRVVGVVPVSDEDELLMKTTRGKIQRVAANEINIIGRNTQGVKIMRLDEGDTLAADRKVPKEDDSAVAKPPPPSHPSPRHQPLSRISMLAAKLMKKNNFLSFNFFVRSSSDRRLFDKNQNPLSTFSTGDSTCLVL